MKGTSQNFVRLAIVVCLGAVWGCASRSSSQAAPPFPSATQPPVSVSPAPEPPSPPSPAATARPQENSPAECRLIRGQDEGAEPIATVALGERVDPAHAPHPSNESERLLFRQVYETLVRVDCDGRTRPGLAASWKMDADGRAWILTLREDARFSDSTPVVATDVASAWTVSGTGTELRPEVRRIVRSVLAVDDRTLAITLRSQRADALLTLAHTDLAIARRVPGSLWPLGTRLASISTDGDKPASGTSALTLIRVPATPAAGASDVSSVRFLLAPGRDARDLLDEGVDLMLTSDPTVLGYAATLPQFVAVPLSWQRTHVLLTPGRARTSPSLSAEAREALAHDAVRGLARGALGPSWWQSLQNCERSDPQPRQQPPSPIARIVYDGNDGTARDLAERLVGLATTSGTGAAAILDPLLLDRPRRTYQRATGLTGDALALALRTGNDAGYIMALESRPLDPCRELQVLMESVGWVDPETIVPLVDTHLRAIVRRGRSGITAEWDGGVLLGDSAK